MPESGLPFGPSASPALPIDPYRDRYMIPHELGDYESGDRVLPVAGFFVRRLEPTGVHGAPIQEVAVMSDMRGCRRPRFMLVFLRFGCWTFIRGTTHTSAYAPGSPFRAAAAGWSYNLNVRPPVWSCV